MSTAEMKNVLPTLVGLVSLTTMNRRSIVDKKRSNRVSGQPQPVAVVLLGDDYAPANETFYLRQEIQESIQWVEVGCT